MKAMIRKLGANEAVNLALLAIAMGALAFGLQSMIRGLDLALALMAALLAMLTSWMLARSPLPGWLALPLILIWSIEALFVRVGNLGSKILAVVSTLPPLAVEVWNWRYATPNSEPLLRALAELWNGVNVLTGRSLVWIRAVVGGTPTFDPVAVALVWSFVVWILAAWAAWATRRRAQTLTALFPALALLAAMLALTRGDTAILLPFVAAMLLMMAFVGYGAREVYWQRTGLDAAEDIPSDLAMVAIPIVTAIIAAAYLTPSLSIQEIVDRAQTKLQEQVGDANHLPDSFGVQPAPRPTTIFDPVRAPGLPRQHLLGSGPELSQRTVMIVTPDVPGNFYWRSSTYDQYTGRGWSTSATEIRDYEAGQNAVEPRSTDRVIRQQVKTYSNVGGLLYATGTPITADHIFRVAWRSNADLFSVNIGTDSYRVDSIVPNVSEVELRVTGSNYPEWVSARYLALPSEVPARVLALARDLTATEPTPYARARAIESYLRTISYTLDLPTPPSNRDVVDYYLFDLKKGYCDYSSTAMVVLARAAGLPAREVVGYSTGRYDEENGRYIITEANGHAWPEIYFADYGWVEFEPTSGLPSRDRSELPLPMPTPVVPRDSFAPRPEPPPWNWIAIAGAGIVLIAIAWIVSGDWRLGLRSPRSVIATLFARMTRRVPSRPADTPNEIAERLVAREPRAKSEVDGLTQLYLKSRYSPRAPSAADRAEAIRLWQRLRGRLRRFIKR